MSEQDDQEKQRKPDYVKILIIVVSVVVGILLAIAALYIVAIGFVVYTCTKH